MNFKNILITLYLCFVTLNAFSQTTNGNDLLKKVDAQVNFSSVDVSAQYSIKTDTPGAGSSSTVVVMFRRDRTNEFLVIVLDPKENRGKAFLQTGGNLELFDPTNKTFVFTDASARFENSNVQTADFSRSNYSKDYSATLTGSESLGKFKCNVLELKAKNNNVIYPKVKLWVSEDNLIRKIEDYSLSNELIRTSTIPNYQLVGTRWLPKNLSIYNHNKQFKINGKIELEKTSVIVTDPSLKAVDNIYFTKEYLNTIRKN